MESTQGKKAETSSRPITIKRKFNLPMNIMWKAWSDEESFQKWWGPNNFTCPYCSIDFVVGGKYLACMRAADGNEMWSTGTYRSIVPQERIVFTDSFSDNKGNIKSASDSGLPGAWPLELTVSLEFEEVDQDVLLTLYHEGIPTEMYEDCMTGWNECFDKLQKNLK